MSENLGDFSQSVQLIKLGSSISKQQEQLIAKQKREYRKHMCAEIMQAMLELDRNMHTSDVLQALADWADEKIQDSRRDRNLGDRRVTALS